MGEIIKFKSPIQILASMYKRLIQNILFLLSLPIANEAISQPISPPSTMDQFAEKVLKDSLRGIIYRVEIAELNEKREPVLIGYDLGSQFIYAGDIPRAVTKLTHCSVARLRIVGKAPNKHISYWGERFSYDAENKGRIEVRPKYQNQSDVGSMLNTTTNPDNQDDPANVMILNVLKMTYGFSVTDIADTCEVWVVKIFDNDKLSSSCQPHLEEGSRGASPIDKDGKHYLKINSDELTPIWASLEFQSKHIVYDETEDKRRFSLIIEYAQLKNFDNANAALAPFGLGLIREKRLEKLKLVTFFE